MDLFKILFKRILYKLPLKLLIIILIVLMLSLVCFNAKAYAYTGYYSFLDNQDYQEIFSSSEHNNVTYISECPSDAYNVLINTTEFQSGNYDYLLLTYNDPSIPSTQEKGRVALFLFDKNSDLKVYPQEFGRGGYIQKLVVSTSLTNYSYQMICDVYGNNLVTYTNPSVSSTLNVICNADNNLGVTYLGVISSRDIYTDNTFNTTFINGFEIDTYTAPYIINSTGLDDWSFNNLFVSLGSEPYRWTEDGIGYEPTWWTLTLTYQSITYTLRLDDYIYIQEGIDEVVFRIPRNILTNFIVFKNGENVILDINQYNIHLGNIRFKTFLLDSFTLTLTAEQEQQINEDSEKQVLGSIDSGISNVNNNLTNISDNITDSDIDNDLANDFADLSDNFSVVDPTSLNEVFDILYGAFCEDEVINLTFTIPFVNKQVTISSANVSANYPQAVKSFISVCSWGVIGLFVLKDIRNIVNKIAEGSPEDVGSDVKKEVL